MAVKKDDHASFLMSQRTAAAECIKDVYPQLRSLKLVLRHRWDDGTVRPHKKGLIALMPDDRALFEFDCPDRECFKGGYDLTQAVSDMVRNRKTEVAGVIACQGWQYRHRVGRFHCSIELLYGITATYKE